MDLGFHTPGADLLDSLVISGAPMVQEAGIGAEGQPQPHLPYTYNTQLIPII